MRIWLLLVPLFLAWEAARAEEPKPGRAYKLTCEYSQRDHFGNGPDVGPPDTEEHWSIDYRHIRTGNVVSSVIDRYDLALKFRNGAATVYSLDHDSFTRNTLKPTEATTIKRKDRPDFFEPIGKPLLDVKIDRVGGELSRELKSNFETRYVNALLRPVIATTRLFHPAFMPEMKEWDAPMSFDFRPNESVKGVLHYKKVGEKEGIVTVKVTGPLISSGLGFNGQGTFEVDGAQEFDLHKDAWLRGSLKMLTRVQRTMESGNRQVVTHVAPVVFTLASEVEVANPGDPAASK